MSKVDVSRLGKVFTKQRDKAMDSLLNRVSHNIDALGRMGERHGLEGMWEMMGPSITKGATQGAMYGAAGGAVLEGLNEANDGNFRPGSMIAAAGRGAILGGGLGGIIGAGRRLSEHPPKRASRASSSKAPPGPAPSASASYGGGTTPHAPPRPAPSASASGPRFGFNRQNLQIAVDDVKSGFSVAKNWLQEHTPSMPSRSQSNQIDLLKSLRQKQRSARIANVKERFSTARNWLQEHTPSMPSRSQSNQIDLLKSLRQKQRSARIANVKERFSTARNWLAADDKAGRMEEMRMRI